ncbi:hypothetical protein BDZ89DRAFT_995540 [Hymenopellis radicata]|nr:hypothetical protein BDZ89DRAFT_995540 [Hymenopellis radicata]
MKYVLGFLLLINIRSFPLVWHFRVLPEFIAFKLRKRLFGLTQKYKSIEAQWAASQAWWDRASPIGEKPFEAVLRYDCFATIDDSDFNLHLSNSSYAKALDPVRFRWAIMFTPQLFREDIGGVLPLAATHFLFIREIPMLVSYEVRIYIASWGDKWLYAYAKFVSKSKKRPQKASPGTISTITAPTPSTSTPTDLNALAAKLAQEDEPDGALVHCISVSQLCFKIGRVTVPPALILALNGFTAKDGYDRKNPPKAYLKLREMGKGVKGFLTGGWRAEEEKWWEEELGGPGGEVKERLRDMEGIRLGMESLKAYRGI